MPFNVFVSWSGPLSKRIAREVWDWLPLVVQDAEPFMSDKDIDAGARGLDEISSQLENIHIGILCLTASNQQSSWLNFEAGALSKLIKSKSYVIPLAFDLDKGQIRQPLGQFQSMYFNREDMLHVVMTVSKALDTKLTEARLERTFDSLWPELEKKIETLKLEHSQHSLMEEPKMRSVEDMLEEIIVTVRDQSQIIRNSTIARPATGGSVTMRSQSSIADAALRRLARTHGEKGFTVEDLAQKHVLFNKDDWRLVETSPFLVWYLSSYYGIQPPKHTRAFPATIEDESAGNMDDVPF